QDNFLIASTRKIAYAAGAGVLLNLSNLFLLAATSAAGMAVSFPIAIGLAVVVATIWNYFPVPQGNPLLLFSGVICLAVSVILTAFAHRSPADSQTPVKPLRPDPRAPAAPRPASTAAGLILSILSGVLLGLVWPLVDNIRTGDSGVGPYLTGVMFA